MLGAPRRPAHCSLRSLLNYEELEVRLPESAGDISERNPNHKEILMSVQNPREIFAQLLSGLRQGTEKSTKFYQELSQIAENPDLKEALEARAFISQKVLATQDQCFKLIGEQPTKVSSRLHDIFVEDFRKELAEIQNPAAKHLFIMAKAIHLTHLRIAEYAALVAAVDVTGHYGVGVLLESCLADKLAFVERTRRMIRNLVETKVAKKLGERVAA
jgi:ferritin-like metal-binding protein YciE